MTIRSLATAALAATMLLGSASFALAAPATTSGASPLYSAPQGNARKLTNIFPGTTVDLGACDGGWCMVTVDGMSGFAPQSIFGGATPQPQPQRPQRPNPGNNNNGPGFNFDFNFGNGNGNGNFDSYPSQRPRPQRPQRPQQSEACFYSNTDFRGASFCVGRGESYDYLPGNWDNRIRSVEVFGRASVDLCRDENLQGACVTLRSSQSRLPNQLDRRGSSLEVY